MQVATRRFIVISAIAVTGAAAGVALGNFVAGGPKVSGLEELAAYNQIFQESEERAVADDTSDPGFASPSGPTSYQCEGCDASLSNEMVPGDAADTRPLPPYLPEEGVVVPLPRVAGPASGVGGIMSPRSGALAADRPRTTPSQSTPQD